MEQSWLEQLRWPFATLQPVIGTSVWRWARRTVGSPGPWMPTHNINGKHSRFQKIIQKQSSWWCVVGPRVKESGAGRLGRWFRGERCGTRWSMGTDGSESWTMKARVGDGDGWIGYSKGAGSSRVSLRSLARRRVHRQSAISSVAAW
jgi:hypothetical protein